MKYRGKEIRHELKYLISTKEYMYLKNRIKNVVDMDENARENNEYHIRSLYFDDIFNSAYKEKEMGIQFRKKYRIRIYNLSDNIIKLEKKNKYDKYINKESLKLSKDEVYKILKGEFEFLKEKPSNLSKEFYIECMSNLMRPRVIVDYDREPYIVKGGNVRITFDKNLRVGVNSYDIFDHKVITNNIFKESIMIMEVKYDSFLPSYIRNLLQLDAHNLSSASKYVLCTKVIKNLRY